MFLCFLNIVWTMFVWSPANFIVGFAFFFNSKDVIDWQIIVAFAKGNTSVRFLWMKLLSKFMYWWRQSALQIGNRSSHCKTWSTINITSNMYIFYLKVYSIAQCLFQMGHSLFSKRNVCFYWRTLITITGKYQYFAPFSLKY